MVAYNRLLLGVYMDWLVHAADRIGYHQQRPMVTAKIDTAAELHNVLRQGIAIDCSESLTLLCHLAGLRGPSGDADGYAYGNTETILAHLNHIAFADALVGDIVIFNADRPLSEQHGVMVRKPGKDPIMFTHGQPIDPRFLKLSQLQPGFTGKTVVCSVGKL